MKKYIRSATTEFTDYDNNETAKALKEFSFWITKEIPKLGLNMNQVVDYLAERTINNPKSAWNFLDDKKAEGERYLDAITRYIDENCETIDDLVRAAKAAVKSYGDLHYLPRDPKHKTVPVPSNVKALIAELASRGVPARAQHIYRYGDDYMVLTMDVSKDDYSEEVVRDLEDLTKAYIPRITDRLRRQPWSGSPVDDYVRLRIPFRAS